jgi:hypothetical protein
VGLAAGGPDLNLKKIASTAWATTLTCNIDRTPLLWTGQTTVEWGQILYGHKCANEHYFWLTSKQMSQ